MHVQLAMKVIPTTLYPTRDLHESYKLRKEWSRLMHYTVQLLTGVLMVGLYTRAMVMLCTIHHIFLHYHAQHNNKTQPHPSQSPSIVVTFILLSFSLCSIADIQKVATIGSVSNTVICQLARWQQHALITITNSYWMNSTCSYVYLLGGSLQCIHVHQPDIAMTTTYHGRNVTVFHSVHITTTITQSQCTVYTQNWHDILEVLVRFG